VGPDLQAVRLAADVPYQEGGAVRLVDVEIRANRVLDAVRNGAPVEDALVELKREWPTDHKRAARRLAGHANAARGAPILWLIGVQDDGSDVPGVSQADLATWWAQVRACFADDVYPSIHDVAIHFEGATVVALAFETDRAPYLVRVAGSTDLEVPWREATGVRSARRSELLLVLSEAISLPEVEVMHAWSEAVIRQSDPGTLDIRVNANCFFDCPPGDSLTFPFHRLEFTASTDKGWKDITLTDITAKPREKSDPHAVSTAHALTFVGPAAVHLSGWAKLPVPSEVPIGALRVAAEMWPTRSDVPLRFAFRIPRDNSSGSTDEFIRFWSWDTDEEPPD
jgi:hypothetical protein